MKEWKVFEAFKNNINEQDKFKNLFITLIDVKTNDSDVWILTDTKCFQL